MESTVVVGYDGSPAAERALVEAAHHAVSRGLPLTIVHALARDGSGAPAPASRGFGESRRRAAEQLLADGADLARYRHPDVVVRTLAVDGPAPATLAQAARGAALLVVGCRGLGRWEGLLLGSVSARVLAEADCPVLVVHDREPVPPGGVLAAVDVEGSGDEVLAFAFAEASRRRVPLRAVHVGDERWVRSSPADAMDVDAAVAMDLADLRVRLGALVHLWQAKYPEVDARYDVAKGADPGAVVAGMSGTVDLVVAGARRHAGGRHGLVAGAVTRALLQRAACPVVIVPSS